jgi:L-ascorbate metabolism protein UlaG (beta-lactamase superfamily)
LSRFSPGAPLPAAGAIPSAEVWERGGFAACWLGHATTLLRAGRTTLLTDPHFDDRVGLRLAGRHIGRKRATALPGGIDDLPPVHLILLSHAHLDHWDRASLTRLARRDAVAVIPPRTRRLLPRGFGGVIELAWEQRVEVGGVHLTAIQPRHWGARYVFDRRRGYNSYLIEEGARRVVFGGDTAHTDAFDRFGRGPRGGVDLAVLGIGSYHEYEHHHATPEQAAAMARRMGARRLMPIHHSTFFDRSEPIDEPIRRLCRAWPRERIVCARVGEAWFGEDDALTAAG